MNRVRLSCWMLLAAAITATVLLFSGGRGKSAVQVETVAVTIGDVAQYAVISGRIGYQDEQVVIASADGMVAQVYVSEGERVAAGEALIRMDASAYERAAAAVLSSVEAANPDLAAVSAVQEALQQTVLRAPCDATVRQILASENGALAAGAPAVVLSSARQEIVCMAAAADAEHIRNGMWARVSSGNTEYGIARVKDVSAPMADEATGRVFCRIALTPEETIDLPAGAAVEVAVYINGRMSVPVLPVQAITPRETVWWVHDGRCTEIPAQIVLSDEMNAWVALPEGITVALDEMEEGQLVAEVNR